MSLKDCSGGNFVRVQDQGPFKNCSVQFGLVFLGRPLHVVRNKETCYLTCILPVTAYGMSVELKCR